MRKSETSIKKTLQVHIPANLVPSGLIPQNLISLKRKRRIALTLLLTLVVCVILLMTLLVVGTAVYLTDRFGFPDSWDLSTGRTKYFLLIGGISLLLGTLFSFVFVRLPLRPVNDFLNGMSMLAGGNFSVRLTVDGIWAGIPAVKEIADSFNTTAAELESTELLRSDFINSFSHEFKTPIVSIAGFARLLRKGGLPRETEEEYLSIIEQESLRLSDMATNVLTMTRMENLTILTGTADYNLSEQIRSCFLLLEDKWTAKSIDVSLDFDEFTVRANEEILKQVWINLLDNAVKFTPVGGSIRVEIRREPCRIFVSIANSGSEIPADKIQRIYEKFYQCDHSRSTGGNGLGLAIVKRAVELHQGLIQVESGNGSTCFTVELPCYF